MFWDQLQLPWRKPKTERFGSIGNANVSLEPPKSLELNPVENVWQFMGNNWLSNRIFKSYEDVLAHCCYAWNKLIDQPWKIMSIGARDRAMRF